MAGFIAFLAWVSYLVITFAMMGVKRKEWTTGAVDETLEAATAEHRRWRLRAMITGLAAFAVIFLSAGTLTALTPLP